MKLDFKSAAFCESLNYGGELLMRLTATWLFVGMAASAARLCWMLPWAVFALVPLLVLIHAMGKVASEVTYEEGPEEEGNAE